MEALFLRGSWSGKMIIAAVQHGGESEEHDDDASSIAFHFDCDEGTSATGELVPPWLSSITYLGDLGAPTLILPARPDEKGDPCQCAAWAHSSATRQRRSTSHSMARCYTAARTRCSGRVAGSGRTERPRPRWSAPLGARCA